MWLRQSIKVSSSPYVRLAQVPLVHLVYRFHIRGLGLHSCHRSMVHQASKLTGSKVRFQAVSGIDGSKKSPSLWFY
jgi:hypothetical protein